MKYVSVSDFGTSTNIWKFLPEEQETVITDNGKPVALLIQLNDMTVEDTVIAIKQAKAINALKSIQQESLKKGLDKISMEEIDEEIKRLRMSRK